MKRIKIFKYEEKYKYKYNIKRKYKKSRKNNSVKINISKYSLRRKTRGNKIKNKSKNNKNIFNVLFNLFGLLLFLISYYFYYLSLEKCYDGEDICSKKLEWIYQKVIQLIISIAIFYFFESYLYKKSIIFV